MCSTSKGKQINLRMRSSPVPFPVEHSPDLHRMVSKKFECSGRDDPSNSSMLRGFFWQAKALRLDADLLQADSAAPPQHVVGLWDPVSCAEGLFTLRAASIVSRARFSGTYKDASSMN